MSQSIPGVAIFVARPGAEAEVEAMLKTLVFPSRAEAGVIHYTLYKDRDNPRRFVFTEAWQDQSAFDRHLASDHVSAAFPRIEGLLESSEVILLDEVYV
ncbi:putative quinol monooxygenase [Oryzifoliimicrobium ureilyticus]|uniref:putative quinol monooxygenase n=1 Tax=Oryzifoliimicrobium ureilyticus TaxID=3113724 RepID=UPI003076661F